MKEKPVFDNSQRWTQLSHAIKFYRKEKKLSQIQLAERAGISRQHLSTVESIRSDRGLSLDALFNIATVLEVEPYLLLKFKMEIHL